MHVAFKLPGPAFDAAAAAASASAVDVGCRTLLEDGKG